MSDPLLLNRWLDRTPIIRLSRADTRFTIPAFSVSRLWKGYSDIVASYNFEASHNFSLVNIPTITSPNYLLCVSYRHGNSVVRYKLWENVGEVLYFYAPLYTSQVIKKNFRLEVWDVTPTITNSVVSTTNLVVGKFVDILGYPLLTVPTVPAGSSFYYILGNETICNYPAFVGMPITRTIYVPGVITVASTSVYLQLTGGDGVTATAKIYAMDITINQTTDIILETSVKQDIDTRHASTINLSDASAKISNFNSNLNLPFVFPTNSISTINI